MSTACRRVRALRKDEEFSLAHEQAHASFAEDLHHYVFDGRIFARCR